MGVIKKSIVRLSKYILYKQEDKDLEFILKNIDFQKIENKRTSFNKEIVFVIPKMTVGFGGLTSILRIAKNVSLNGYKVYFASFECDDLTLMAQNAKQNLNDFKGEFITYQDALNREFDFVVATSFQSVYFAKKIKGYKLYFVQDYEPYFHSVGNFYFLAKKTYEMGLHMISLGSWNVKQIKLYATSNDLKIDYVDFPFEANEYHYVKKDFASYKNKKKITLACYAKRDARRIAGIVMNMLEHAYYDLKKMGIELEINYFGLNPREKIKCGKNLGRLNKKDLEKLYHNSDFGLSASMTNVSLVPFEMIGSGLPLFEFKDGSFTHFLGEDSATLLDFDYHTFVNKLLELINEPCLIETRCENAFDSIKSLSWSATGKQFVDILNSIE